MAAGLNGGSVRSLRSSAMRCDTRSGNRPLRLTRRQLSPTLRSMSQSSSHRAERALALGLALALAGYATFALAVGHWWVSGVAAPVVAALILARHRRARFSAYIFFSVVVARGVLTGWWMLAGGAVAAILLLQTPLALRTWPRLPTPARMTRP